MSSSNDTYIPPILKVIINRAQFIGSGTPDSSPENIKLIFIGQIPDEINKILRKLELGQILKKEEETILNDTIPYFKTKVGSLDVGLYKIHFINLTIPNNINTAHLELLALDILKGLGYTPNLKQIKAGIILYGFPRILPYNYIYDVLEYLYQDTDELLTGEQICSQLVNKLIISSPSNSSNKNNPVAELKQQQQQQQHDIVEKKDLEIVLKELQKTQSSAYSPGQRDNITNMIKLLKNHINTGRTNIDLLQTELRKLSIKTYSPHLHRLINKLKIPGKKTKSGRVISNKNDTEMNAVQKLLNDLKLSPTVAYSSLELSNNTDFQKVCRGIPYLITPRRFKKTTFEELYVTNDIFSFEGLAFFQADERDSLTKSVKYSYPDLLEYTQFDNGQLDDIVNFAGLTTNNTLFAYLGDDIHKWYDGLPQSVGKNNNFPLFIHGLLHRPTKFATLEEFAVAAINNRRNFRATNTLGVWTQLSLDKLAKNPKWSELSNTVKSGLCNQSIFDVTSIKIKNFIFDCYDMGIETHINLKSIFQDIETNYYLPLVKYVSDRETQLYNIYKPFFRNLDEKILNLFLRGKDRIMLFNEEILATSGKANIRRLKQLINWDYIVFKWRVDDENLINIYLFENGYIINEYQSGQATETNQYIEQSRIITYMKLLTKIITKIKEKYKITELQLPNPEKILKQTAGQVEYSNLINMGMKLELNLNNRVLWAWNKLTAPSIGSNGQVVLPKITKMDEWVKAGGPSQAFKNIISGGWLIKKLNQALDNQPNILVTHKYDEEILFLYTSEFGFYSRDNIKYFMRNYLRNKGDRVSTAEKEKMFATVSRIFKITLEECQSVFTDIQSVELQSKYSLVYHIDCRIKINNAGQSLTLTIDNISQNNNTGLIINQLEILIKDILLGTEQTVVLDNILENESAITHLTTEFAVTNPTGAKLVGVEKPAKMSKHGQNTIDHLLELDMGGVADINLLDFENLDLGGIDLGGLEIDLDMDAIEKLVLMENEEAKSGSDSMENKSRKLSHKKDGTAEKVGVQEEGFQDIKLKQFVGNKSKTSVGDYMKEMRRLYDPELFEPVVKGKPSDYSYERDNCPGTPKRQPFIVNKEELKKIDPESITGYMRYNNNYYICPRIWDAKAGLPISARKFIENGLRSPYTGGLPIPNTGSKNMITDKYSVIIRKPTTSTEWSDPTLHPEWPEILKKTEKEAYPGLTHGKKHPNKVCVPCCFKHKPDDFDNNKKELHQFLKVSSAATCQYHGEPESYPGAGDSILPANKAIPRADKTVETFCKNEKYISNAGTILKNCRLGLLPEELNILLNNSQEIFMKQNDTEIGDNANLFLRRGINDNHVTNILDTFSAIFEIRIERLINIIYNKLTPIDFIELNNGELIDIFCSASDYPIDSKDRERFIKFLTGYSELLEYLNIDIRDILLNLENRDINLAGSAPIYDNTRHLISINTQLLYRIFTSYYNYLSYIVSPNEIKNYKYVIQIFSKPRKWLIPQGANILIFDKNSSQIKCLDNFNYKTDRVIILIEERANYFIPVFHIQTKFNQLQQPNGIIKLDNNINLSNGMADTIAKKRPTQQKLIDNTKDRLSSIIRLLYISSGLCNYNMIHYHAKIVTTIKNTRLKIFNQYLGLGQNSQIQYFRLGTSEKAGVFIPIYPHFIEKHVVVNDFYGLAENMNTAKFNLTKLADSLYPVANTEKSAEPYELMVLLDMGYHITEIIIEKLGKSTGDQARILTTGVRFANDLELPLLPQEFKAKEINNIITRISGARSSGLSASLVSKPIVNLLKVLSSPSSISQVSFNIHALLNLLIHQTKNNLSYYISSQKHLKTSGEGESGNKDKKTILQLIGQIYNTNETARDEHLFYTLLDDTLQQIIKIDKQTLTEYIRNYFTDRKTGRSRLVDKSFTRKVVDLVCKQTVKGGAPGSKDPIAALCIRESVGNYSRTRVRMPAEIYEYILMAIGKDLINNKIEADTIVKGRYIIPVDDLISAQVSNTIYNQSGMIKDGDNFRQNLIISPAEMSYYVTHNLISKYRRNFKLQNPSAAIEINKEAHISNQDLDVLASIVVKDIKNRMVSGLSGIFSSISSSSKSAETSQTVSIKATVFNSEGILNPMARHAACVFPYKSSGRLNYQCGPAKDVLNGNKRRLEQEGLKDTDLICPTEINSDKTVINWGYCPSTDSAAQARLGKPGQITDAYQFMNKNTLKKIGNCDFPFLFVNRRVVNPLSRVKPFISISYSCANQGNMAPLANGTWCFTNKLNNIPKNPTSSNQNISKKDGENDNPEIDTELNNAASGFGKNISLLIGADRRENIYKGDWSLDGLVNSQTGAPDIKDIDEKWAMKTGKQSAICEITADDTKREKIEKALELDDVVPIKPEEYNPDYCVLSTSKKGYTKKQLYLFGRDVLGINYRSMLNENNNIINKDSELCDLINGKIRDMKKAEILAAAGTQDPEKLREIQQSVYTKDPTQCLKGPTKGGYKLTELRDMAITYFGLSQSQADKLSKEGLCEHITKSLGLSVKFNREGSEGSEESDTKIRDTEIYPADRNIELCNRPTNRGGLSSNDLKHIAGTKLGLDITGKSKEELCQIIKQKMIEIANAPTESGTAFLGTNLGKIDEALKSVRETGQIGEFDVSQVDKIRL